MGRLRRVESIVLLLVMVTVLASFLDGPASAAGPAGWRGADTERIWHFPRDHGAHGAYKTEWWYFTGNLTDDQGKRYGYQLTFFREGVCFRPADPLNPWSVRDLYLAHFAITDVSGKRFSFDERASRAGPALAGASADSLHAWLLNWRAMEKGGHLLVEARNDAASVNLDLIPLKPPAVNGERGLSRKGSGKGQASYYVSCTSLATSGLVKAPGMAYPVCMRGVSWFDHEFGSNQLNPDQAGWDWFGLHLSDGRDLMLYFLRRIDGSVEPASSGTIVEASGVAGHLTLAQVKLDVLDHWRSQRSRGIYPSRWRLRVPSMRLDVVVSPLLLDQELSTPESTGVTYWEGAVEGEGVSGNQGITCRGYVEMTGYAGKLGGVF